MERLIAGARKLGIDLSKQQVDSFQRYYEELVRWNSRVNLTAIVDYEEVQLKHFLDSLTVGLCLGDAPFLVLDVGTGAGFPGLPLRLLRSSIKLSLLESREKKSAFLRHVIAVLDLEGVEVITGRAEDFARDPRYRDRFDYVLSRGVAGLSTLVELCLPFCAVGGSLVAQRKGDVEEEVRAAAKAVEALGGRVRQVKWVSIDELGDRRALLVVDKRISTPQRYPRRAGIPQKRPLGHTKGEGGRRPFVEDRD